MVTNNQLYRGNPDAIYNDPADTRADARRQADATVKRVPTNGTLQTTATLNHTAHGAEEPEDILYVWFRQQELER